MYKVHLISYLTLFLLISSFTNVQGKEAQDSLFFEKYIQEFQDQDTLQIGKLLTRTALYFRGKPYVASTLEVNGDNEALVVNLHQFDCNTFVETCMALTLTIKEKDKTYSNFKKILQKIRYRSGDIEGYTSRLHYVSDWKFDNQKKEILLDITPLLGGKQIEKKIDFMSTHSQLYRKLNLNSSSVNEIIKIEDEITDRNNYFIVDKRELNKLDDKIKDGDIIAFATSIDGLDYSHIAIAHHSKFGLSFIHASTRAMSIIEEPQSLYNYCLNSKKITGISVFRLNNPQ